MKVSHFIAIILFGFAGIVCGASIQDWQGEWGSWKMEGDRYHGASITIFNCDENASSCKLRFDAESAIDARCEESDKDGILLKISSGTGTTQFQSYDGTPKECTLSIKLEEAGNTKQLRVAHSGSECGYFCTGHVNIPEVYPLKSSRLFARSFTRDCYGDPRKSREALCTDPDLQKLEGSAEETSNQIDELNQNGKMYERIPEIRETPLTECASAADVAACLRSAYEKKQKELDGLKAQAQDAREKKDKALATPGDAAKASLLIGQIEGVYKEHFQNGLIDGTGYTSEDILELVRVTDDTLYFRTHLEFYNGHICEIYGLARYSQAGTFVHNEPPLLEEDPPCQLQIQVTDKDITFVDPDGTCNPGHCGMRGSLSKEGFARTTRRTIRYMTILKNSQEYKESVATLENKTEQQTQE